jgi:hypothetical protein
VTDATLPDLVLPWPRHAGTPVCTVTVGAPAGAALSVIAEELRSAGLRVRVDRRGVSARTGGARVPTAIGAVAGGLFGGGGDSFSPPVFRVSITEDDPRRCVLEAGVPDLDRRSSTLREQAPAAVSRALRRLWADGAAVQAGPWERRGLRGRRYPIPPEG